MSSDGSEKNARALDALIALSLRPENSPALTEDDIRRYMEQNVTLGPNDDAALRASKPELDRKIQAIIEGAEKPEVAASVEHAKAVPLAMPRAGTHREANPEFVEAILIAHLVRIFATPQYPLGRFRYNKLAYFCHRRAAEDVKIHFLKKAAGPYSPWAKYRGPENIALRNGYVKRFAVEKREGLVAADKISSIDTYVVRYPVCHAATWVAEVFRFFKSDHLELLTTVDFAVLDLKERRSRITIPEVKGVISSNKEWAPKLERGLFSDECIGSALKELSALFPSSYG